MNLTTSAHGAWTDLGSVNKHKGYSTSLWKTHGASGLVGKEGATVVCPTNPIKAPPSPPSRRRFGRESMEDDEDEDDDDDDEEEEEEEEELEEEEVYNVGDRVEVTNPY